MRDLKWIVWKAGCVCGRGAQDEEAVANAKSGEVVWLQHPPEYIHVHLPVLDKFPEIPSVLVNGVRTVPLKKKPDTEMVGGHRVPFLWHHVDLANAATVNKAQGKTLEKAVIVYDGKTTYEKFLVGCTRVRQACDLRIMPSLDLKDSNFSSLLKLKPDKHVAEWFAGEFDQNGYRKYEASKKIDPKPQPKRQPKKRCIEPPADEPRLAKKRLDTNKPACPVPSKASAVG